MNRGNSKYFLTAQCMDEALLALLDEKDFEYITVKELCEKAGVNRSTFYLHYDSMDDLLNEAKEYIMQLVYSYYPDKTLSKSDVLNLPKEKLNFFSPEYLVPFFRFIKDHRRLFLTILEHNKTLKGEKNLESLFSAYFNIIYQRFSLSEKEGNYISIFLIDGTLGIAELWLRNDCRDSEEELANLISSFALEK